MATDSAAGTARDMKPGATRQRVVVVSEVFPPDIAGSGITASTVAAGLVEHHDVTVIAGAPDFTGGGVRAPWRETWRGMNVIRCRTLGLGKNHFWDRSARAVVVSATMTATVARHLRPDDLLLIVVAPGLLSWAAVQAARLRGARIGLLVYDVFPENLVPAGVVPPDSLALRALQRLYHPLYRQAHGVSVLGRDMADKVRQMGGQGCAPVVVAPHWADLDEVSPLGPGETSLRGEFGIDEGRFVFLFAGNLGRVQGLETVAAAMGLLRGERDLLALFVGAGAGQARLRGAAAELGLDNVMFRPMLPRAAQRRLLATADVGLVTFCPGMLGLAVAGKTPNLLAAGKPILAMLDEEAETARLLAEEQVGWTVPPGDAPALAATMRRLSATRQEVDQMASRARGAAARRFDRGNMIAATLELLDIMRRGDRARPGEPRGASDAD